MGVGTEVNAPMKKEVTRELLVWRHLLEGMGEGCTYGTKSRTNVPARKELAIFSNGFQAIFFGLECPPRVVNEARKLSCPGENVGIVLPTNSLRSNQSCRCHFLQLEN